MPNLFNIRNHVHKILIYMHPRRASGYQHIYIILTEDRVSSGVQKKINIYFLMENY